MLSFVTLNMYLPAGKNLKNLPMINNNDLKILRFPFMSSK